MKKIDRLIADAKRVSVLDEEKRKDASIKEAISRMSMEQLRELVYDSPSKEREKELFAAVGLCLT